MVWIKSAGYAFAKNKISNEFIENLDIGTNSEWIISKIGIQERLTSLPLDYIKETRNQFPEKAREVADTNWLKLAKESIEMTLDRGNLTPKDIGLVIGNCCTPFYSYPPASDEIVHIFNMNCKALDLFTACPVFALHINFVNNLDLDSLPDYILCFSSATLTQHVSYNDRSASAIWGDGAAAWIISTKEKGALEVVDSYYTSDPTRSQSVVINTFGHFDQQGRQVRDFSVRQTVRLIKQLEKKHQIDWNRDVFIGHQANATMLEQIRNNRKIPPENHWHNVEHIGNQAGASAPAVLAMHWDNIQKGQNIIVAVVGAGLSWGSVLLRAV